VAYLLDLNVQGLEFKSLATKYDSVLQTFHQISLCCVAYCGDGASYLSHALALWV